MKTKTVLFTALTATFLTLPARAQVTEQRLGPIPENRLHERVTPGGHHIAWIIKRDGKERVVYDGQEGPAYDQVYVFVPKDFTPDLGETGRKLREHGVNLEEIYKTANKESWASWLDSSPNGKHWAYKAR
ncbi:MAG: hypothetical protein ACYTAS_05265 [Planctomycetota bacterium]|jgi:hypothetical protein